MKKPHDYGLAIIRWAECRAIRAQMPVWSYVGQVVGCGSTTAGEICREQMPKLGWRKVPVGEIFLGVVVYACEWPGDVPKRMMLKPDGWYRVKTRNRLTKVEYTPKWWRPI
jgi:hypothetical protein